LSWSLGKDELGGFLAYFENKFPEKFKRLIKDFGIFQVSLGIKYKEEIQKQAGLYLIQTNVYIIVSFASD